MSKIKKYLLIIIPVLVVIGWLMSYEEEAISEGNTSAISEKIAVKSLTVVPEKKKDVRTYYGELQFAKSTQFTAQQPGVVSNIRVKPGDQIRKGELVIKFPPLNHKLQISQAEIEQDKLISDHKRQSKLLEAGAVSKTTVESLKTQIRINSKQIDQLKHNNVIEAPFTGVITDVFAKIGEEVNPGQVLFSLAKTEHIEVSFFVSPKQINHIQIGDSSWFKMDNEIIRGVVTKKSIQLNPKRKAFKVMATFNTNALQFVGNTVKIHVELNQITTQIKIPSQALRTENRLNYVYTISEGKSLKTKVQIGDRNESHVEILSGLSSGDRIILEGSDKVEHLSSIKIID